MRWPNPILLRRIMADNAVRLRQEGGGRVHIIGRDMGWTSEFFFDHLENLRHGDGREFPEDLDTIKDQIRLEPTIDLAGSIILQNILAVGASRVVADNGHMSDGTFASLVTRTQAAGVETSAHCVAKVIKGGENLPTSYSLVHRLTPATVVQFQQYRDHAFRSVQDVRAGVTHREDSPVIVTRLYSERISKIEGACWDEVPCTEENKKSWIEAVPWQWISVVMQEDAEGARAANFT